MAKYNTELQVSAGGVAYRPGKNGSEIVLISVRGRWQLPKGIVKQGEAIEHAAQREVREEAGIETELVAPIDTIEYWYFSKGKNNPIRIHKYVHFFLLRYRSGDPSNHDYEVDEAHWVAIVQAKTNLSFGNEQAIVAIAEEMIQDGEESGLAGDRNSH